MTSIQERLQLKRVPLDTWNIREQLCLASAVVRSGDQNWMSVSRALKTVGEPNRPPDWYSQKSCAAQYGALLEHVETPKRKKRSSEGAVETPQESILKRLTQERIVEIQKNLAEMNQQYEQLKNEIIETRNPNTSEERLKELWTGIETAKRARERENARRAAWLKEREERRARAEKTWRPPTGQTPTSGTGTPIPPASPLLTSLLKSSPVVTTPQHIPHPANVVETVSPSAGAPTLSMLLEKSGSGGSSPHENKHAAIEQIKSQLVQIEQQLKASTSTSSSVTLPPVPAVDIDDIEIKAEDVYAFRDIDLHIPPVATMHKGNNRIAEKPIFKKDEGPTDLPPVEMTEQIIEKYIKEETTNTNIDEVLPAQAETNTEEISVEESHQPIPEPQEVTQENDVKIAFPEVKFPTPEIKVIQPEDQKIKEEIKEPDVPVVEVEEEPDKIPEVEEVTTVVEEINKTSENVAEANVEIKTEEQIQTEEIEHTEIMEAFPDPENIPLPPEPSPQPQFIEQPVNLEIPLTIDQETLVTQEESKDDKQEEHKKEIEEIHSEPPVTENTTKEIKKEEDADDLIPLKEIAKETVQETEVKEERVEPEDTHTETDDDTPMELSREEEKDGKKKRDYSRKKKPDSRTCSGSESAAEASAPESPSASDAERQHRLWKKSVMLVYSRLCAHKYASLFLRPITDEEAPGYSLVVKRPMDLTTIKKNIEAGVIRTTAEFQRDVLLMLSNALMYNSSEHSVYQMAKEMHEEAQCQLGMLLAAQAHAGLAECPPQRRKRRRPDSPSVTSKRTHH